MPSSRGRSRAGGHGLRGLGPAAPVQAPGEYRAGHGEQEAGDQALQNQPHLRAPVGALQGLADAAGEGGARGGAQPRIAQRHPAQGVGAPQRVPLCEKWERVCAQFGWRDMNLDNGLSSRHTCAGRAVSAQARSKTLEGKVTGSSQASFVIHLADAPFLFGAPDCSPTPRRACRAPPPASPGSLLRSDSSLQRVRLCT